MRAGRDVSRIDAIIGAITADPNITQTSISEQTGIPVSSVKRILSELKTEGAIVRQGSDRKGRWIVKDRI